MKITTFLIIISATTACASMRQDLPLTKVGAHGLELSNIDVIVASSTDKHKIIGKLKTRMNQLLKLKELTILELTELSDIQYELRELTKKK